MERLSDVEDWAKSARAQVGTFAHGRGDTERLLSRGEEMVRAFQEAMLKRRGAEITAALFLLLILGANFLRGWAACRRAKKAWRGL